MATVLATESTVLVRDALIDRLSGLGVPPLKALWQFAAEQKMPICI